MVPRTKAQKNNSEPDADKLPRWTIMLYIAADATLANFGVESLKQLNESVSHPYSPQPSVTATVKVAAQFSIDAPGGQVIPRYVFDECSGGPIGQSIKQRFPAPPNMSEQDALSSFIDWVFQQPDLDADHYALILWSHGPELFLQPPPGDPKGSSASLYLTPIELRRALLDSVPQDKRDRIEVIAFDACSMSMIEMAYELRGLVKYMIASQEEVPDLSFPYGSLVQLFRTHGHDIEGLIKLGVKSYVTAYQDYIANKITAMNPVTLSALALREFPDLIGGIKDLATSLLDSIGDQDLPAYLMDARARSRDYAGGLYVDLVDFCTYLDDLLAPSTDSDAAEAKLLSEQRPTVKSPALALSIAHKKKIRQACSRIRVALGACPKPSRFVLANSSDIRSHGVSIYFPYLSDDQLSDIEQPMVKSTRDVPLKGLSAALNVSASGYLMGVRQELILNTESYYDALALAADTSWYEFLTQMWARILIQLSPDALDSRYSAVQCAINAIRPRKKP